MVEIIGYIKLTEGTIAQALTFFPREPSLENPQQLLHDGTFRGQQMPGPGIIIQTEEGIIYRSNSKPPVVLNL